MRGRHLKARYDALIVLESIVFIGGAIMKKRKSSVPSSKSKKSTHAAEPDRVNRADRLIDRAILAIQNKSSELLSKRRLDDEAKYVQLLETMYKSARTLDDQDL